MARRTCEHFFFLSQVQVSGMLERYQVRAASHGEFMPESSVMLRNFRACSTVLVGWRGRSSLSALSRPRLGEQRLVHPHCCVQLHPAHYALDRSP